MLFWIGVSQSRTKARHEKIFSAILKEKVGENLELRLLRYFWTVTQEKTISKAAQVLQITQPTLSRQIKELEEHVGVALFQREKQTLQLTQEGRFLKERAEEILILNDRLEQAFRDQKKQQLAGSFSIGCVEADNSDTVAMMIEELVRDYPQVHFDLVTDTSEDIIERLEKGLLDLAVLLEPIELENFEQLRLPREETWGFLVSNELFIARQTTMTQKQLTGLPIICSKRAEVQQLLAKWAEVPLAELNIIGNFNLSFNALPLVANKVGAAFSIEGAVSNRQSAELAFLPLDPPVKTNCALVWKKRVHTPIVQELIRRFKQAFQG